MASTVVLKYFAIFIDKVVEGTNLPDSMEWIVCFETFTASARSLCVMLSFALSTFIVFFMYYPNIAVKSKATVATARYASRLHLFFPIFLMMFLSLAVSSKSHSRSK